MKRSKIIAIMLSALLTVGCKNNTAADISANATDSSVTTSTSETTDNIVIESQAEITSVSKTFERISLTNLSEAEQIYSSLCNLAEFERYITFGLHDDIDIEDRIDIEKLHLPYTVSVDEWVGTVDTEIYYRIASGKMSDGVELSMWLDSFTSQEYIYKTFYEWYDDKFMVSNGKIYVTRNILEYYGNWLVTDDFSLDKITALDNETIQLDFSFTDYGIEIGSMPEVTEYFTVVMKNNYGWKIDSYSEGCGMIALINELVYNENPSSLQEQIENYLSENPI